MSGENNARILGLDMSLPADIKIAQEIARRVAAYCTPIVSGQSIINDPLDVWESDCRPHRGSWGSIPRAARIEIDGKPIERVVALDRKAGLALVLDRKEQAIRHRLVSGTVKAIT